MKTSPKRAPADAPTLRKLEAKHAALRVGRAAEAAVAEDLAMRGLRILGTNIRIGRLELDIVARDGDTVVVVEVRTRGGNSWQTGLTSLVGAKSKRVRAAGEQLWRQRFQRDKSVNRMRFDVAVVVFSDAAAPQIEYARGVF